ncbi:MAG: SpoIIE family protein phosphatase [Candidatus Aminicenantes bacterium]|nr:SpoIIE family protein phosphatase [Candidatus Aminicenantes bacterium]
MKKPQLFVYPKGRESFCYEFDNDIVRMGRSGDNEISIPDPFSSGHHAQIERSGKDFILKDNDSKNGTFLNGEKIKSQTKLKEGDEILVGSTRVVFNKKLSTNVEITDSAQVSPNVNTIMHLDDVLRKKDVSTTIEATQRSFDIEQIKQEHKALSVISEVSKTLVLHKPLKELLEHIMDLICENLPMDRGVLMIKEGNPEQFIPKVIRVNNTSLMNKKINVSQSIVDMSVNKHSSILVSDVQADPRFKAQESVIRFNISSAMCVPLWNNKEIIGIIYSDRISLNKQFTEEDLKLLTLLSNLAAVKIENARNIEEIIEKERMEKELDTAAGIQRNLLPKKDPKIKGYEISGRNIPCYQVGGDYYDFIPIDEHRLGIVIADVSGKGVGASLLMASLRASLYSEASKDTDVQDMASKLNDFVNKSSSLNSFITFFYLELDTRSGDFKYINAGHNPPLIIDKKGKVSCLECSGLSLGMFPSVCYEGKKDHLDSEGLVVLYTDGITESRNKKEEEFGEQGLKDHIKKQRKKNPSEILDSLFEQVNEFISGMERMDDMTAVIIKKK